jgi:hypothetical protein
VVAVALAASLVLAACGDDDDDAARGANGTTTTAPADGATSAPTTAAPGGGGGANAGGGGAACAPTDAAAPAGATTAPTIDVDGDGEDDTMWMSGASPSDGARTFGITTASGATFSTPFNSASPIAASALAFEPDERLPAYVLISDGRIGSLWVVADCAISQVTNPQGEQYTFDLGGFTGYGTRDLVGLLAESDDPSTTRITRTIIELDGASASNGASDEITAHSPADDTEIESARTVSCGDLTLDGNGVHEPE